MSAHHSVTLPNGLTVLVEPSGSAPVVSCWIGYRVGSRNEQAGRTGLSHWVEHMTFKGTRSLAKGELFRVVGRAGGTNNGFTGADHTCYYETLPGSEWELGLRVESERMSTARFDPAETESERTVILSERAGNENQPRYRLHELLVQEVFRRHPYRFPVIGTREDLQAITHRGLVEHYRAYYRPGNAVLALAGSVDPTTALAAVEQHFGEIPDGIATEVPVPEEPPQDGERRVELRAPGANPFLMIHWRAPARGHPDCDALLLLDAVLSGARPPGRGGGVVLGRSARLHRALVDPGLAVSAATGFRPMRDPYVFTAGLTPAPGTDPLEAERRLIGCVEGLVEHPVTEEERDRALRQMEAQQLYASEGATGRASLRLLAALAGDPEEPDRRIDRLRALRPEDLSGAAGRWLHQRGRTVGWFFPEGPA